MKLAHMSAHGNRTQWSESSIITMTKVASEKKLSFANGKLFVPSTFLSFGYTYLNSKYFKKFMVIQIVHISRRRMQSQSKKYAISKLALCNLNLGCEPTTVH